MKLAGRRLSAVAAALACMWAVFDGTVLTGQVSPDASFNALTAAPGLEVRLFASETNVINPTVIAVDERGRVWVAEGVNYRRFANVPIGG
ncbi:MAG: DUF7133 domain-containing protein, partial [Vicinamibacterales bacterium]